MWEFTEWCNGCFHNIPVWAVVVYPGLWSSSPWVTLTPLWYTNLVMPGSSGLLRSICQWIHNANVPALFIPLCHLLVDDDDLFLDEVTLADDDGTALCNDAGLGMHHSPCTCWQTDLVLQGLKTPCPLKCLGKKCMCYDDAINLWERINTTRVLILKFGHLIHGVV